MENLRVYYVERQRLTAADLKSEQEYLIGLDLRHKLSQHMPGIVRGLRIRRVSDEFQVEPGIAIDSFGRELVLQEAEPLSIDKADKCVDVWLVYCREPSRLRRPGRAPCSENSFERWLETPRVLPLRALKGEDPEMPVEGAVFLGRIECEDRPDVAYTGLRGIEVADPARRALMQVGPRTARDPYGFVLSVADDIGTLSQRIVMDRRGNNFFFGTIELDGSLDLFGSRAKRVLSLLKGEQRLIVEARELGKAGEQVQLKVEPAIPGDKQISKVTLLNPAKGVVPEELIIRPGPGEPARTIAEFNKTSKLVRLSLLDKATSNGEEPQEQGPDDSGLPVLSMCSIRAWVFAVAMSSMKWRRSSSRNHCSSTRLPPSISAPHMTSAIFEPIR